MRSYTKRLNALRNKLYPKPIREIWMPIAVCVTQGEDGEYSYASGDDRLIDMRCKKIGIVPNIYIIGDDGFNPNDDGVEGREPLENIEPF
jgi:hypothetical protein